MNFGLGSFVGQSEIKKLVNIEIKYCQKTGSVFGHSLLTGMGGLGKTAFAHAIANELNYHIVTVEGSALSSRSVLTDRLIAAANEAKSTNRKLLFFVDEAHRLSTVNQEALYYPMDKNNPRITTPNGTVSFPKFCLIAATTRLDCLEQNSFITRFENQWQFKPYDVHWLCDILSQWFKNEKVATSFESIKTISEKSLGVPRQAIRLATKVRNYIIALGKTCIQKQDCEQVFALEGIDSIGLSKLHIEYLMHLKMGEGVPRGLASISGELRQNQELIAGTIEPVLLSLGFIGLNNRGRFITKTGLMHLRKR